MKPKEPIQNKLWYPLYEMVDTFLFWTSKTTQNAPYIRDGIDIKRVMSYVVLGDSTLRIDVLVQHRLPS